MQISSASNKQTNKTQNTQKTLNPFYGYYTIKIVFHSGVNTVCHIYIYIYKKFNMISVGWDLVIYFTATRVVLYNLVLKEAKNSSVNLCDMQLIIMSISEYLPAFGWPSPYKTGGKLLQFILLFHLSVLAVYYFISIELLVIILRMLLL